MNTRCHLIRRGYMYDVYIDGKKYGSGQWGYVDTAYLFYRAEGFDVDIIDPVFQSARDRKKQS